jgi:hypothetical protein
MRLDGKRWPYPDPLPRFRKVLGDGLRLLEVFDETQMKDELGYPLDRPIPDYYGITDRGKGILWEHKTVGRLNRALVQLESGLAWMRPNGHQVDMLGIQVERMDGKGPWRRTPGGILALRALGEIPIVKGGLQVMVEEARDG